MHHAIEAERRSGEARSVTIHSQGEGEQLWFLDTLFTVKTSGRSGARLGLAEQSLPVGSETPFHRHATDDEAFYVLEGTMALFLEGERRLEARPGSFVHIPHGVAHGFRATSALRILVLSDPDGFPEFVRDCSVAAPRRELPPAAPPDLPRLLAAAGRHGIEFLGPLPERA